MLGTKLRGTLSRGVLHLLLAPLSECADIQLDGARVTASTERVGLVVRVEDDGDGFRVLARPDPRIKATLADGVVLRGDTLCPAAPAGLSGRELEDLTRGQRFEAGEVARLVTELLPSLKGRLPIEIATERLPRTVELPPRVRLEVRRDGEALDVLPTLVYGDPPVARVDGGRLVSLGGPVPLRDEVEERRVVAQLAQDLELLPGHRVRASGADAIELAARLGRFRGEIRGDAHLGFVPAPPLTASLRVGRRGFRARLRFGAGRRRTRAPGRPRPRAARLARRRRLRPARGRRLAPLPADWLARTASASPTCSPRAASAARCRAARCPTSRGCATRSSAPRPPALRGAARAGRRLRGRSRTPRCPRICARRCARTSSAASTGSRSCATPGSAACSPTTWASARRSRRSCALRGRTLVVGADERALQLGRGDRALPARPRASRIYHGPRPRARRRRPTSTLTSYADPAPRRRRARAASTWDTVDPRRGADHQEPRQPGRARRATGCDAGFRVDAVRHAGREPPRRAVEPAPLHEPRPARRPRRLPGALRPRRSRTAIAAAAARLRERIRPFVLRRMKREVAPELPPRTEVVLHVELDGRRARALRRDARRDPARTSSRGSRQRRQRDRRARGAAAPAPGRLPPRPACPGGPARAELVEARAPARGARGRRRRRPQGARVLAVDVAARSSSSRTCRAPASRFVAPRRLDPRPRRGRRALPGRRRARR